MAIRVSFSIRALFGDNRSCVFRCVNFGWRTFLFLGGKTLKKTNIFLASGIVGIVATLLSNILANVFNNIVIGIWQYLIPLNTLQGILMLMNAVEISVAMIVGFIVYCKLICKTETHISKFVLFSIAAALVNVILVFLIKVNAPLLYYLIDFVILTAFALIAFNKVALFQKNTEYELKKQIKTIETKGKYYPSFWIIVIIGYIIFTATSVCIIGFINEWDYTFGAIIGLVLINTVFSVVCTYLYFLPYLLANKKKHRQTRAIYILNIFAGWTFIAWLIALIWGCTESSEKKYIQQTVQISNADELMKYKNLLDSGVITQEEFDNKKNKLLQ